MTNKLAEVSQQVVDDLQRRLDESVAQQAATADILKIISRSTFDLQTVLETLIKSAVELSGADRGSIFLRDGDLFPLKAASSTTPEFLQYWAANPPKAGRGSATSRVIASGKIEVIPDVLEDPDMEMPAGSLNRIRAALGVPMLRSDKVEGVIVLTRPEPGPFGKSQIDLVQTFADQAMIAIENVRLFDEVQAKTADLSESLQQQTATADVLKVISRSVFDLQPVLDTLVDAAYKLCGAKVGLLYLRGEEAFECKAVAGAGVTEASRLFRGRPIRAGRGTAGERVILTGEVQSITSFLDDPEMDPKIRDAILNADSSGSSISQIRSTLAVPMTRDNAVVGVMVIGCSQTGPFPQRQIELLQTFADQAVIAIENARLFDEVQTKTADLEESLQHQTATSEVLQVISRSPGELDPVFQTILASATRICDAQFGLLLLYEDGGFRCTSTFNLPPTFAETFLRNPVIYPPPIDPLGRLIETRQLVHVVDVKQEPAYLTGFPPIVELVELGGARTLLLVPMFRENDIAGVIAIFRQNVHAFSDKQIDLVTSFGRQAVIAIENARLLGELHKRTDDLSESLRHQTATSEVLKVISRSPGELDPVFQTILASATGICDAQFGNLFVLHEDGGLRCASVFSLPAAFAETFSRNPVIYPPPIDPLGRLIATRQLVHILDVAQEPAYLTGFPPIVDLVELGGARTVLLVPMLKEDKLVGVLAIFRQTVQAFSEKQIDLVTSFASQAVIAIENARLLSELRERTDDLSESLQQQTATADVLKVISRSAFDLKSVLTTLTESAQSLCGASLGIICLRDGEVMRLQAESGCTPAFVEFMQAHPIKPGRETITGRVFVDGTPVHVPDVELDAEYNFGNAPTIGAYRAVLAVPLMRDGAVEGVLLLGRPEPGPFGQRQQELVQTFADQAVIAIENVRLFDEVQARTRELSLSLEDLRTAQDRLVQTEKLASLGQLTAGIAHEIKNPLNFVNNFSSLSGELIDELNDLLQSAKLDGKTREEVDELTQMLKGNLDKVVQHGKRADSIVKNMLLHSREGSGDRRPADINTIVEESLNLAYHGARAEKSGFNITLQRDLDPSAGIIDLYPQEITRVFLNLISNGFYAANKRKEAASDGFEPLLTATTKNLGSKVEIRIRDNGTGIPAEVKDKMFNPFFTTKPAGEGTGLGLSMSHDIIVKQHGGKIDVETEPGAFTEFIITLPRAAVQTGGRT
ncbi:His Kinase A (phospho-acceptor) domain-containing protein [Bradyrhizobium erythrophlei]|uniref:histidine kinase n=1 Tax=Bradyrhizobium erythrophlei TaxID=1437360 RepID=A0A1M7TBG3_9BRAD|nr:GAF domain-containing protein [Bradyrhizobium erythrophlei]SHN68055.1 His Kinase A (phospho-acceptor) domain-containing protein [Bradyrhizobium erythrophlei]